MKVNWGKLIFFILMMISYFLIIGWFATRADENEKANKKDYYKSHYSRMSDSPEIKNAYKNN